MSEPDVSDDALRAGLLARIGEPMGTGGPSVAPDPVNLAMIRHWVDAFDDRNPVYLDAGAAARAGFGDIVAPPAMLQTWTMPRPRIEGIRARGGAPGEIDPRSQGSTPHSMRLEPAWATLVGSDLPITE